MSQMNISASVPSNPTNSVAFKSNSETIDDDVALFYHAYQNSEKVKVGDKIVDGELLEEVLADLIFHQIEDVIVQMDG